MKKPKRYYCGNGEGMFEDNKNGDWVEYSEHKAIVEALTKQLRKHAVVERSELCDHPRSDRSYIGHNMLRCNKCGKEFS